jgi:hypothetical protein
VFEDLLSGLGPHERVVAVVPAADKWVDGVDEVLDADEAATVDGLAGDWCQKDDLYYVQSGAADRGEVRSDPRVVLQPGMNCGGSMMP